MIEKLNLEEVNNPGEAILKAFSILNQLVDAVNELPLAKDVIFNRIDMLNNAICDIRNAANTATISKKKKSRNSCRKHAR